MKHQLKNRNQLKNRINQIGLLLYVITFVLLFFPIYTSTTVTEQASILSIDLFSSMLLLLFITFGMLISFFERNVAGYFVTSLMSIMVLLAVNHTITHRTDYGIFDISNANYTIIIVLLLSNAVIGLIHFVQRHKTKILSMEY